MERNLPSPTPESTAQVHFLKLPRLQKEALKTQSSTQGKPITEIMSGYVAKFLRIIESSKQDAAKDYIHFVQKDAESVRSQLKKEDPAWMGEGMCFRELLFLPNTIDRSLKNTAQAEDIDPRSLIEDIIVRSLHHSPT